VRAHSIAKEQGLQVLPGVRLVFADGMADILAYPNGLPGWSNLTRLLTIGKRRAAKGECELFLADLLERAAGLSLIVTTASTASPSGSPGKAPGSPPPPQGQRYTSHTNGQGVVCHDHPDHACTI
jgi:DNA polymerase III alpha subunit